MQCSVAKITNRKNLIAKISGTDPELSRLVETLLRTSVDLGINQKNIFAAPVAQDFNLLNGILSSSVEIPQSLVWQLKETCFSKTSVLPIRAFRGELAQVWGAVDKLRIFLSSGTTSGPEGRSRSGFSPKGALLYRAASIATFYGVLETLAGRFSDDILNTRILSLIPTVDEWTDSSLAQMLAWFSEVWDVRYMDSENPHKLQETIRLMGAAHPGQPLIVFGTAFHFVNLLEAQETFPLPPQSIVIETGGTKGKSRSVTRSELYDLICDGFKINAEQIVSEYGMCELASQAWDVVPLGKSANLCDRKFHFPWWVQTGVMANSSEAICPGSGCLTIYDPLRVDLSEVAIQAEDLARVHEDGSFELLGRVPRAPLKGCSLKAEGHPARKLSSELSAPATKSSSIGSKVTIDRTIYGSTALKTRRWFLELLSDQTASARLENEFGSEIIAREAISSMNSGLPLDADGFIQAAINACDGKSLAEKWLFIPPASHSIAAIQPLAAALTLGLKVRVRLPSIQGLTPEKTFLARAIELAASAGFSVQGLPHTWRLGLNDLDDGEHALVFGDDETLLFFEQFAPRRISGFGNAVCVSASTALEFKEPQHVKNVLNDLLNLKQRGCLSSRTLIVFGGNPQTIVTGLNAFIPKVFTASAPTIGERCARSMEFIRLSQAGFILGPEESAVTIAAKNSSLPAFANDFAAALSRLDLVVSVICLPEDTDIKTLINLMKSLVPLRAIATSDDLLERLVKHKMTEKYPNQFSVVRSGTLGAPRFDGTHLGRQYFALRD